MLAMPDNAFSLPSFAKINLGLRVIGKRDDGFHDIFTIFQTVSLHDTLSFALSDELVLTCTDERVPSDERNLVIRAAQMLRDRTSQKRGARIHLEKRIPSPGGLGGGSSNAAAALIGLTRLWHLDITPDELIKIGSDLGSDVAFFFTGGTAIGRGRGTDIESIADFRSENVLIVAAGVEVSTASAFNALNARRLTTNEANRILGVCRSEAESVDSYLETASNDFENTVFAAHPEIGKVKQRLLELGASVASMSGSGASVFGIFDTKETRQAAQKALGYEVNWRKFAVATISRDAYREALGITF